MAFSNLQEMVEKNVPIYVINRSAKVLGKPHLLMLEFRNPAGGRSSTVKLPPMPYPVNLSQRVAPPEAIPASQDFVDLINRGVLELVPPDKANSILKDPEVQASVRHAFSKLERRRQRPGKKKPDFRVKSGGSRMTDAVSHFDESEMTAGDFMRNLQEESAFDVEEVNSQEALRVADSVTITPKIQQMVSDLLENPDLKKDYLMDLKAMDKDGLTDEDLHYMMDHLRSFDQITNYLRSVLAERAGKKSDGKKSSKSKKNTIMDLD